MDKQAELAAKLEVLRQSFLDQLPSRLQEIEAAWLKVNEGEWDREALATTHRLVHSLTGTAGTFGAMELSAHSRIVERHLKDLGASENVPQADERDSLGRMIEELRYFIDSSADQDASEPGEIAERRSLDASACVLLLSTDQALIRELSAQMGYFAYELSIADEPETLVALANDQQPAALIIDVHFDGDVCTDCSVIPRIQSSCEKQVPVLFLADTGSLNERITAVRAGADAYMLKPVDVTALVDRLDHLTGNWEAQPYRILVVDDEPTLAERYALLLETAGMEVRAVTNSMEIMPALVELQPDVVLMDLYMPDCSGAELASVIRQQDAYVSLPIVFLSSETDLDKQFAAMSLGGDDFLTKPIQDRHLVKAVKNRAERARLINSLMAKDSLTGLLKHTKLKEKLEIELSRAKREGGQLSYVMVDIDNFKRVNDTYGHLAGDRVIKSLAHLLRQRLRRSDIVGRYGGEEFAIIMPDTGKEEAAKVIDAVRIGFSMIRHNWHDEKISATFSAGVACYPQYGESSAVTGAADEALYKAKGAGRNRVVCDDS